MIRKLCILNYIPRQSPFPCWKLGVKFWTRNSIQMDKINCLRSFFDNPLRRNNAVVNKLWPAPMSSTYLPEEKAQFSIRVYERLLQLLRIEFRVDLFQTSPIIRTMPSEHFGLNQIISLFWGREKAGNELSLPKLFQFFLGV